MKEILLVVDIQHGFSYRDGYDRVVNWINKNRDRYDTVIGVVFANSEDSPVYKTTGIDICMSFDSIQVDYDADIMTVKQGYAFTEVDKYIPRGDVNITVVGTDAECCILATCYELFDKGYNFHVLGDMVLSSSKKYKEEAFDIMRKNFGNDIIIKDD